MTPTASPAPAPRFPRSHLLFLAATLIWAAVMIDTGDIAWPLAAWVSTALVPLLLRKREPGTPASGPSGPQRP